MTVKLSGELQARIFRQMEATYPNEGGGFLLGHNQDGGVQVDEVMQIDNVFEEAEQYHRYAMSPQDWTRLEDEAEARGLALLGYYHSHPDSPAVPSEYDRSHALPNFTYLITAVQGGKAVDMRAWRLSDDRAQFDRQELTVS